MVRYGLAFSVPNGMKIPPSLRNILKVGKYTKGVKNGDLTHWAEQGVLLLNTSLTVTEKNSILIVNMEPLRIK